MKTSVDAVYFPVGTEMEIVNLKPELKELQGIVDGLIEMVPVCEKYWLIVNEEGKLLGLPPNIVLTYDGKIIDVVVGNALIIGVDEYGEPRTLTEEELDEITARVEYKTFIDDPGTIIKFLEVCGQ